MKKRKKSARIHQEQPIAWLPIDSRLFSPFFSFSHVHGMARVFLTIEMVLSLTIVVGTLATVWMKFFS